MTCAMAVPKGCYGITNPSSLRANEARIQKVWRMYIPKPTWQLHIVVKSTFLRHISDSSRFPNGEQTEV